MDNKLIYFAHSNQDCAMRAAPLREGEAAQKVSGYAMRFESPTVLFKIGDTEYKEIIDRNALNGCDMTDVVFDRGHAMEDKVLARTGNGTLELEVDNNGLLFRAEIIDTQEGVDTYKLIKRGDINACSFAAVIAEDSYDRQTNTRRILRFEKLYDVAAVTFPAYKDTEVSAEMRSAFGIGESSGDELELQKQKILLSL